MNGLSEAIGMTNLIALTALAATRERLHIAYGTAKSPPDLIVVPAADLHAIDAYVQELEAENEALRRQELPDLRDELRRRGFRT